MKSSRASIIDIPEGFFANGYPVLSPDRNFTKTVPSRYNSAKFEFSEETEKDESRMIDTVTGLFYLLRVSRIKNDGLVFRLHALTTILILAFSAIISSKQVAGNPIECVHTRDIPEEAFNTYCWIHSTYFVTGTMLGVAGVNVAFPGVGPSLGGLQIDRDRHYQHDHRIIDESPPKRIKYYQWVVFILLLQLKILHKRAIVEEVAAYFDRDVFFKKEMEKIWKTEWDNNTHNT